MDTILQAFDTAELLWEQSLEQLSWHHWLLLMAYLGGAWLCFLNGHIAAGRSGDGEEQPGVWYLAAAVLCLLGLNTVLQLDVILTQTARTAAKFDGWYGQRRALQYELLAGLVLMALLAWWRLRAAFVAAIPESEPVALGMALVVLVLLMRAVSAHGTDALLNLNLAGFSAQRWLEFGGLGLVALGCWRCLRLR